MSREEPMGRETGGEVEGRSVGREVGGDAATELLPTHPASPSSWPDEA